MAGSIAALAGAPEVRIDHRRLVTALAMLLVVALPALLGAGFIGGGADDGTYLAIARQWASGGPQIPVDHWGGRWPLLLPLALSIKLFGVHRWAIALPSFLAAAGSLFLIRRLGDRHFGAPVGLAAAGILAILPPFASAATTASIEPIELLAVLAGFTFVRRPVIAGLMLGLAFQARETSIAALPALLWLAPNRRGAALMLAGFALPGLVELVSFYALTGDPLFRRHLSLAHTTVRSSELGVATAHPLFNAAVIRGWHYVPGLHAHWLLDGYLNLFANPATAFLPALSLILVVRAPDRRTRFLVLAALGYSAVLIYALAIDPKPRMFLPVWAALALAAAASACWRRDPVDTACVGVLVVAAALMAAAQPGSSYWQGIAAQWALERPGMIAVPQRGYFVFSPELERLPAAGRPLVLVLKSTDCASPAPEDPIDLSGWPVERQADAGRIASAAGYRWHLCLYRAH